MPLGETLWSQFSATEIFWASVWWLALCGVTAWLAQGKGQNATRFFAIAFFFSPVIGLLALVAARDLRGASEAQLARDEFRELLGPLMLQIDGIRGHLAVSSESSRAPAQAAAPTSPPKAAQATAPAAAPAPSPVAASPPSPAAASTPPPKKVSVAAPSPSETTEPRTAPALANGASSS